MKCAVDFDLIAPGGGLTRSVPWNRVFDLPGPDVDSASSAVAEFLDEPVDRVVIWLIEEVKA